MNKTRTLSTTQRAGLIAFLWLLLLLIAFIASNNLPILFSRLPGLGAVCFGACGLIIVFSMLAAAIHISVDEVKGKYPYGK